MNDPMEDECVSVFVELLCAYSCLTEINLLDVCFRTPTTLIVAIETY